MNYWVNEVNNRLNIAMKVKKNNFLIANYRFFFFIDNFYIYQFKYFF